jgi:hypothetical protein
VVVVAFWSRLQSRAKSSLEMAVARDRAGSAAISWLLMAWLILRLMLD